MIIVMPPLPIALIAASLPKDRRQHHLLVQRLELTHERQQHTHHATSSSSAPAAAEAANSSNAGAWCTLDRAFKKSDHLPILLSPLAMQTIKSDPRVMNDKRNLSGRDVDTFIGAISIDEYAAGEEVSTSKIIPWIPRCCSMKAGSRQGFFKTSWLFNSTKQRRSK